MIITQELNPDAVLLGFFWGWVLKLSERLNHIFVGAYDIEKTHELPSNVKCFRFSYWLLFSTWLRIVRLHASRRLDIVFTHMCPEFTIALAPICKLLRIPIVMWYLHRHAGARLKIAYALSDKVVTGHPDGCRIGGDKTVVLGHGIQLPKAIKGSHEKSNIILNVGRVSKIKKLEVIIRGVHSILKDGFDIQLVIVGPIIDDGYYMSLLKLAEALSMKEKITFTGPISHSVIEEYYAQAKAFVTASMSGLDKAPLEAMVRGIPCLVCDPSFKMLLGDLASRYMFQRGNPEDLAAKLQQILLTGDEDGGFTRQVRQRVVDTHSLDALIEKLVHVFEETQYVGGRSC